MALPVCKTQLSRRIPVAETGADKSVMWIISKQFGYLLIYYRGSYSPSLLTENSSAAGTSHSFTTGRIIKSPLSVSQLLVGKANYAKYQ